MTYWVEFQLNKNCSKKFWGQKQRRNNHCHSEIYRSKFYILNSLLVWIQTTETLWWEIGGYLQCNRLPRTPADVEDAEQTSFHAKTSVRDNTEAVINNAAVKWLLQELNKQTRVMNGMRWDNMCQLIHTSHPCHFNNYVINTANWIE